MMKKIVLLLFIMQLTILVSCSGPSKKVDLEQPTEVKPAVVETQPVMVTPQNTPEAAAENKFIVPVEGTRPVAVMIDNEGTKPLPQGGLDKAQLIYEITVEGGETRLMPVFWGTKPEMIGPVRSSRHYFLDYVMEHDAVYVHFGWSPRAMSDIPKLKINNINGVGYGGEIFWDLTKDRKNWQDSYTSMDRIMDFVQKAKYRTVTDKKLVFTYNNEDKQLENGQNAEKIAIKCNSAYNVGYEYDSSLRVYKKFRKDKPHMERVSGKQLEVKNIIIQTVPNSRIKGDDKDRQDLYNTGSGKGYYITCGKAIKIKWSKKDRSAPTRYLDESDSPITLNPGLTWVQIVPVSGKTTIE